VKGQRDRALLLLTLACALRRAEAAALDVADLRYDEDGHWGAAEQKTRL
jgi:integrase